MSRLEFVRSSWKSIWSLYVIYQKSRISKYVQVVILINIYPTDLNEVQAWSNGILDEINSPVPIF